MSNKINRTNDTPKTNKALAYARVSSKEQDTEGFSVASQQKLLQSYAAENRIVIEKEFIDVETAKASGRANFTEMVNYNLILRKASRFSKWRKMHNACSRTSSRWRRGGS